MADPSAALPRPAQDGAGPVEAVRAILAAVRADGDAALRELAQRFDGVAPEHLRVPPDELGAAAQRIDPEVLAALQFARDRIRAFHETQRRAPHTFTLDGVSVEGRQQPVDRAGCYVPGGRAAYPSTLLMTAVPALVAGVAQVAVCVPPAPGTGRIADVTLAAAHVAGVDEVYAVGGAQAIGAMTYGTETVAAVDVIVGPGNVYVAIAKREVAGVVGIPSAFAGPSEIVVIADGTAPAAFAAIDLLVQAEHGPGGLAWLITWDAVVADAVCAAAAELTVAAPRRVEIEATLAEGGYAVVVDDAAAAIAVANAIAPEHLQLMTADPEALLAGVRHAGAVFCGAMAPASIGDYVAGPSHVLPTNGTARFAGALTVDDFCKELHIVRLDAAGFAAVAGATEILASAEGLDAHAQSIRLRRSARP